MRVGVLLGDQIAGDVARVLDAQAQIGHDGGLLHDQFVAVVGTAGVVQIEDERQIVLGVIFRAQIALLERAVGAGALARIVNPANQVIVVVLFADAAQVGREGAAHHVRAFADRMAGQAAARFEEHLAVRRVAGSLLFAAPGRSGRTAR